MGGGIAGFGNSPSSRAIKVSIVGNASPRWRGVSAAEADRSNQQLSIQRAEVTKAQVVAELRRRFGAGIEIQFDVSNASGVSGGAVQVGSYGEGSRRTLEEAGGNRNNNADYSRRVEVAIEMVTAKGQLVQQSLPPAVISAETRFWYVSIKEIHVAAIAGAVGEVVLILRNSLSGKKMLARAKLYGGGINSTLTSGKKAAQWRGVGADLASMFLTKYPEASFSVNQEIGFRHFDRVLIRLEKVEAKLGYGATLIYMTMLGFGPGAELIPLLRKHGWGLPKLEGWVVAGRLFLEGSDPGDYWEEDGQIQSSMTWTDKSWNEVLVLNFDTGSAVLLSGDRVRLTEYIATWSRRLLPGS